MAKGEICQVIPCKNIITKGRKGIICGTHRWRKTKFGSYDLPTHKGMPSFLFEKPALPHGIVKICEKHGELTIDDTYPKRYKGEINSYDCKNCLLDNNIKRKYDGMNSLDDYERILAEQNGVCAICGGLNTTTRNGKIKRFAIDHCHKTGKTRGLLCSFCNALIGYARDDIKTLQSAINYLKNHE